MGNAVVTPCFQREANSSFAKLIFWEGTTRTLKGKHIAGDIMSEFPDKMVCHAESFFIGQPIPALANDADLVPGQTYFVLPIDHFPCNVLSASSLAAFGPSLTKSPIKFGDCPFQYFKDGSGRVSLKVMPEFISRLIIRDNKEIGKEIGMEGNSRFLCNTPELQKHYDQLVKSKDQVWSPKLETISEYKTKFLPCTSIGFEWKEKEKSMG